MVTNSHCMRGDGTSTSIGYSRASHHFRLSRMTDTDGGD